MVFKNLKSLDLEERFFIHLLYLVMIVAVISIAGNLIIGLPFHVNYKWFFMILLVPFVDRDIRAKRRYVFWHYVIFGILIFVLLPLGWMSTGGYNYLVMAYVFLICVVVCFLMEGKARTLFLISELIVVALLLGFQDQLPYLYEYKNFKMKMIDLAIQLPLSFGTLAYAAVTFSNTWRDEHRQLEDYGDLLRIKNEELEYINRRDELTGVFNRRYIFQYLGQIKAQEETIQIGMIDMDNFKYVNDQFGHLVGDQVICIVCDLIVEYIGERGIVGRYGGDEFIVILESMTLSESRHCLEIIRENLKTSQELMGYPISFSCGLTTLARDEAVDEALSRADKLLYEIKHNGKDGIAV